MHRSLRSLLHPPLNATIVGQTAKMTPGVVELSIFRVAIAATLFLAINWIGRHSSVLGYQTVTMFAEPEEEALAFNFLFRTATPVVGLILVSAVCYAIRLDAYTHNIYWAIVWYMVFRCTYNVARGWTLLLPWPRIVFQWALMFATGWFAYDKIIRHRHVLLPDMQNISNEMWLAVVAYLYLVASKVITEDRKKSVRSRRYIRARFVAFEKRFGSIIGRLTESQRFQAVIYAVMLVEDFNRPATVRILERLASRAGLAKTTGIMQVAAGRPVSDEESVRIGGTRILSDWRMVASGNDWKESDRSRAYLNDEQILRSEEWNAIHLALTHYNPSGDYAREVAGLAVQIQKEFFPNAKESLHPSVAHV